MTSFPSVQKVPLSKSRTEFVIKEMIEKFYSELIGRRILKPVYLQANDKEYRETNFVKYGFNSIVDRIWLVDGVYEGSTYACQGIGSDFGVGLAESETAYVLKSIIDNPKIKTLNFTEPIKPSDVSNLLALLNSRNKSPTIFLTNIRDEIQLWHYPEFQVPGKIGIPTNFSGLKNSVEINFFRLLPEGTSILMDTSDLGELLIKQRIEETAAIIEIKEPEYDTILKEIPTLNRDQLKEKARVLVYETIKAKINNPLSAVILKQSSMS